MTRKILVLLEMLPCLIIIEMMIFFSTPVKSNVKFLKKYPILLFGADDNTVIRLINTILYRNFLGLHFFVGNCMRYSLLGFAFFSKRYDGLSVALGVRQRAGLIQGHMWLENCSIRMFEPESTGVEYKKLGAFTG